jgi:hypothetical protein
MATCAAGSMVFVHAVWGAFLTFGLIRLSRAPADADAVLGERSQADEDSDLHLPGVGGAAVCERDEDGPWQHGATFWFHVML